MKKIIAALTLAAATLMSGTAFAQIFKEGPWMVRFRAVNLKSTNTDSTGLGLSINEKNNSRG